MGYISAYRDYNTVIVWERDENGNRITKEYPAPYNFYVKNTEGEFKSIYGEKLSKFEVDNFEQFYSAKNKLLEKGFELFESDISPELKILINNYYNKPAPNLHILYYDIEVDYNPEIGFSSPDNPYAPISAISFYKAWEDKYYVLSVPPKNWNGKFSEEFKNSAEILIFNNEKDLLKCFINHIENADYLIGWNSEGFDAPYITKRTEKVLGHGYVRYFSFEKGKMPEYKLEKNKFGSENTVVKWCGRVNADYMLLFKKFEQENRQSYSLDAIADEICPDFVKLKYEGSLYDLYNKDYEYFLRYNLRDVQILKQFEDKLGYVSLSINFYTASCGLYDHIYGTTKLADQYIIAYCHHELNLIVPDIKEKEFRKAAGAYVIPTKPGMYQWVGSVDVNSLYPSSILSINISPETLIGQFSNEEEDFLKISQDSDDICSLVCENGDTEDKSAKEWKQYLSDKKYCISGFGTVFDQNTMGIIPKIIANWFSKRKEYKNLKDQYYKSDKQKSEYYDKLQYIFKIRLNSLYGALLNQYFRFYDFRMGSSTTATGRHILKHQTCQIVQCLDGEYKPESDNIITGDTDSCYFVTPASNLEEAIEISDSIEKIVNKSFPKFMRKTFLCNPGYDNKIKSVRDIVADKCIFVAKKNYICNLQRQEDKILHNKIKIAGLEIKKTTIPKEISKTLITSIHSFLMDDNWDNFSEKIINYKNKLEKIENMMEIGIPNGINKVEEYTQMYQLQKEKARLPGHVAASILTNMMINQYNDKETSIIKSGMKIKRFNLKMKYKNKFNSIALPAETYKIPEWFKEEFYDKIDIDSHIERLIDGPLSPICEAINKKVPNKQYEYSKSKFEF